MHLNYRLLNFTSLTQNHNMKKIVLSIFVMALSVSAIAQQRLVLGESFSQASCGPCAAQNPAFNALIGNNSTKIVTVKYQVSWPGFDPMYEHNPAEIDARVAYYGISGVPDRVMDGTNMDITQGAIDTRYAVAAPVNMTISHTINPGFGSANVTVTITAPDVWNPSNTVLQLAMVEKEIVFATPPGSNGETEFSSVMRKMIPNQSGSPVVASNFAAAGGTQTFTFNNVAIPSYIYDVSQIAFVAWVQNNTSKEVHQAGYSAPVPLADFAVVSSVSVPGYSCSTELSGASITLRNDGTTAISSATVNYQIDNGTVQTAPFTGNIAPDGTANFTIPTTAVSSGSHTLTTYLTNINNSGLNTPVGTKTAIFATISAPGATGVFSQNFSSASFPYANYYLSSPSSTNWDRVTANTGSIRFNNYVYASGSIGEVYLAPVDMSSISEKVMTFDVAYRQYTTESDRLEVLASSDCGATWSPVFDKAGTELSTLAAATAPFTPSAASQWRNESVSLSNFGSATKLIIKFRATSDYGNNLFVDNINIGVLGVTEVENAIGLNVYPNPAAEMVNISFNATGGDYAFQMTDLQGRVVESRTMNNLNGAQLINITTENLAKGSYLINIISNGATTTKKIVVM